MSTKILISTAAIGLLFFGSASAYGQRNLLEGIIGGVINEALNNNQRQQPTQGRGGFRRLPNESGVAPHGAAYGAPAESGKAPSNNSFNSSAWLRVLQQQQQRPQQQYVQPRTYTRPSTNPLQYYQKPTYTYQQPKYQTQPSYNANQQPTYQSPPTYTYATQQPTYETQPQTVYPRASTTPTYSTTTVMKPAPTAVESIKITLPKHQSEVCSFTLINGTKEFARALSPGQMQKLKGSPNTWHARFKSPAGTKLYRLRDDTSYVFQSQGGGLWQLYKQPKVVVEEPPELPQ